MNVLILGSDKAPISRYFSERFLLIDDGEFSDRLTFPDHYQVVRFDVSKHSFNPLADLDYRKAREFVSVLDAVFPEGENTLTKQRSRFQILRSLLNEPTDLETLIRDSRETEHAYQTIQTLLLSPVLKDVLTRPTNISFKGIILAKLDRSVLGDFDSFVLANFLISQYEGPVVIPDFGFYAHQGHARLMRQNRLIAGVSAFEELPDWKHRLLSFPTKVGSRCNSDDADLLALYTSKFARGTEGFLADRDAYMRSA